jgi:L-rhamnonate dehydratase
MSVYREYADSRASWGIDAFHHPLVVEITAENGATGFAVGGGGEPVAAVIRDHLAPLLRGRDLRSIGALNDQMARSSAHYARHGIGVWSRATIDLALWDLLGKVLKQPVWALLGARPDHEIQCYCTGPDPRFAVDAGFAGAKIPLMTQGADRRNWLTALDGQLQTLRDELPETFELMLDCWMSLDLPSATSLIEIARRNRVTWIEEPLASGDYHGHSLLRHRANGNPLIAAGEHEAGLAGFHTLISTGCVDIVQPDLTMCGGLSELVRIAALADAAGVPVIPHVSSPYSYHFVAGRPGIARAEFFANSPTGTELVPPLAGLLVGEPMPHNGTIRLSERPGFGVELAPSVASQLSEL